MSWNNNMNIAEDRKIKGSPESVTWPPPSPGKMHMMDTASDDEMDEVEEVDYEAVRKALVSMVIVDELPFRIVENEGFLEFVSIVCPGFLVPSWKDVARDCVKLYADEKQKIKTYFNQSKQRVSLTTDTWTSNQGINYVCLTAHFIDDSWKMNKLILNFVPCYSHKGEDVGKLIEGCLLDWGIENVFTITDNASSNDTCVEHPREKFVQQKQVVMGGKFLHIRCVAQIINLVVTNGLKEVSESVDRVRALVRFIKQSPSRMRKFKVFAREEKIGSKKSLCLDDPTRWNSVYFMLQSASEFKKVFDRYILFDNDVYDDYLKEEGELFEVGLPTKDDWVKIEEMVKVLRHFHDLALKVSSTKYVVSNWFLDVIFDTDGFMEQFVDKVMELKNIVSLMKAKFDMYLGEPEKRNMLLYVAMVLDPRHKSKDLKKVFDEVYGSKAELMNKLVTDVLFEMFGEYKLNYDPKLKVSSSSGPTASDTHAHNERRIIRAKRLDNKTELDKYLGEKQVKYVKDFNILEWWRLNSARFPVLSIMARDVLAMPVSTVSSKTAFSMGDCVIDDFRLSWPPLTCQALISAQDWLLNIHFDSVKEDSDVMDTTEKGKLSNIGFKSTILGLGKGCKYATFDNLQLQVKN